ncbi:MAG: redox-sensing transcriptional repressor Rex [Candidatus Riflebacteria bacterium RBG_13_59_9]|nr:MAG: redox-sensing transcriptional repressor Rex [Candidatus Riflebacteria bacterium RBG_13_59_9]
MSPAGEKGKSLRSAIPYSTVVRLAQYLRILERLEAVGTTKINSNELAKEAKVNSFLVRKDLSYFGEFGVRGVGYEIKSLIREVQRILGLNRERRVVLVGIGHLGRALLSYKGFAEEGFHICGLFDSDPAKIRTTVNDLLVRSVFTLEDFVEESGAVDIGIIAVPAFSAQFVANTLVAVGVKGLLNFAPIPLTVPPHIITVSVDLTTNLEVISYFLSQR